MSQCNIHTYGKAGAEKFAHSLITQLPILRQLRNCLTHESEYQSGDKGLDITRIWCLLDTGPSSAPAGRADISQG
jgi:hypothetical protein